MITLFKNYLLSQTLATGEKNEALLSELLEKKFHTKLLDVGCGDGTMIIKRTKRSLQQPMLYGIDIDPQKVKRANKLGIKTKVGSVEKHFPYKGNYFDVVCANQIIEHLNDIDTFVSEIYRVLKPNGYALISTENLASWHNIFSLLMGWQPFSEHISKIKNIGNPYRMGNSTNYDSSGMHVRVLTLLSLTQLFTLYSFSVEEVFGLGYYPFPAPFSTWIAKINPNHAACIIIKARKTI